MSADSTKPTAPKPLVTLTDHPMPKPAYLQGKRTVVPPQRTPLAPLPEWPDYLIETWQHVINSTNFVSYIRTRVGNTLYEGKLTATLQDVQLTQSIEDGPTVKMVVENMIELGLKQMNDEIEAAKAKSLAAQDAEKKRAAAEAAAEKFVQESYERCGAFGYGYHCSLARGHASEEHRDNTTAPGNLSIVWPNENDDGAI